MLRLPQPGERLPPLVVPIKGSEPEEVKTEKAEHSAHRHGRKKRRSRRSGGHDWDSESRHHRGTRHGERRRMRWMMAGGVVLLVAILGAVMVAMLGGGRTDVPAAGPTATAPTLPAEATAETPAAPVKSDVAILEEAEPVIRKFMEAKTIADMLPLVRHPEITEKHMRRQYPDGAIDAPGISAFNTTNMISRLGPAMSLQVRTDDFDDKVIVFFETPEGIKVDWESWVGWSEIPWKEFLATKPTEPKVFRVKLSSVDYFNFGFSDDLKWQSYRLTSPDDDHSIYGYVLRESELNSKLRLAPEVKQSVLTLALKFPPNAQSGNQVLIDKILAESWVLESETEP